MLLIALVASLMSPAAAETKPKASKGKVWDVQRYVNCTAKIGGTDLDTETTFTSRKCRTRVQDEKDPANGDFWIDPSVRAVVRGTTVRYYLDLDITYERSKGEILGVPLSSGANGPARFEKVNLLLTDGLHTFDPKSSVNLDDCSVDGNKWATSTSCSFSEVLSVELTTEDLLTLKSLITPEAVTTKIRGKATSETGESIAFWIDAAEIFSIIAHAENAAHPG